MRRKIKKVSEEASPVLSKDWLVPSTLIIGICVSIVIFVLTTPSYLTNLLLATAITSIISISLLMFNLLWVIGFLDTEFIKPHELENTSPNYLQNIHYSTLFIGMFFFMISLSLLCFTKSLALGIICSILAVAVFVLFVVLTLKTLDETPKT